MCENYLTFSLTNIIDMIIPYDHIVKLLDSPTDDMSVNLHGLFHMTYSEIISMVHYLEVQRKV